MRAKKHLGQNFLNSKSTLLAIAREAELSLDDIVLEIGPGKGVLTEVLIEKAKRVIAVEKDGELISLLQEKFTNEIISGKLKLIHADILNFKHEDFGLMDGGYKLIANIPYYITGAIFKKFLESKHPPKKAVLLIQKEVAERIIAKPARTGKTGKGNKESILSISVKVFGKPKLVKKVPKRYFSPEPKVDSAILSISNIRTPFDKNRDKEKFFNTVKTGFAHKRKLLINNLETSSEKFSACDIKESARAENLSVSQWLCLSKKL